MNTRRPDPKYNAAALWDCLTRPLDALAHIGRLRAFLSFRDFELHFITFLKALVTLGCDGAVMNKKIRGVRTSDEPVAFGVVEPLYRAFHRSPYPLFPHAP